MARQFRNDDTSLWIDKFGYGSDGAYAPSTGTDAPIDSACTGTINTTSLSATNAGFAPGQFILVHQTQGVGAGQWELNKIQSYTAGTITTSYPLIYAYVTGAQVLVMPQYSSGIIDTGQTITLKAWNGTVGGIYAKFCNGTFSIVGTLTGTGKGFGGGARVDSQTGYQGKGTSGDGSQTTSANGNGGGGGSGADNSTNMGGGAGGGNVGAGTNGETKDRAGGTGGSAIGNASLTTMVLGGGGGAGGDGDQGLGAGAGGTGGGMCLIISKEITITGSIVSLGAVGAQPEVGDRHGAGGGGAGGSILLKGQKVILGSSLITATGGAGGTQSQGGDGGAGGNGGIHADYALSFTGTTTPTLNSAQDFSLLSSGTMTTNTKKW